MRSLKVRPHSTCDLLIPPPRAHPQRHEGKHAGHHASGTCTAVPNQELPDARQQVTTIHTKGSASAMKRRGADTHGSGSRSHRSQAEWKKPYPKKESTLYEFTYMEL